MSCKACDDAQEMHYAYYFRWKNANIELRGCKDHIKEVMDALGKAGKEKL